MRESCRYAEAAVQIYCPCDAEPHELSVVLCDDDHIQALNLEWRRKDAATDVLSFPMGDDVPPGYPARMLGDLVISLDTAARQAADAG
jgi:probable rRNA maturation factor